MVFVRAVGWALVLLGLLVLGRDLWAWRQDAPLQRVRPDMFDAEAGGVPLTTGELWLELHAPSLQLLEPALDRHVAGWFGHDAAGLPHVLPYQQVVQPMLLWPASAVLAGLGLVIVVAFRRWGRRRAEPLPA